MTDFIKDFPSKQWSTISEHSARPQHALRQQISPETVFFFGLLNKNTEKKSKKVKNFLEFMDNNSSWKKNALSIIFLTR